MRSNFSLCCQVASTQNVELKILSNLEFFARPTATQYADPNEIYTDEYTVRILLRANFCSDA